MSILKPSIKTSRRQEKINEAWKRGAEVRARNSRLSSQLLKQEKERLKSRTKKLEATRAKTAIRHNFRKEIAKRNGVRFERVVLNSKVDKKTKVEDIKYTIRK